MASRDDILVIGLMEGGAISWDSSLALEWRRSGSWKRLDALLRVGAFREGPSRTKLLSLGVPLSHSLNLLIPRPGNAKLNPANRVLRAETLTVARALIPQIVDAGYRKIITTGSTVYEAFSRASSKTAEIKAVPLFKNRCCKVITRHWSGRVTLIEDVKHLVLPHPSGRNHFWNEPQNARRVAMLVELFKDMS